MLRDTSVRQKLLAASMVPTTAAIIIVALIVGAYLRAQFRRETVDSLTAVASIVGDNCSAALAFRDTSLAIDIVNSLQVRPSIVSAMIYDDGNGLFASFRRDTNDVGAQPELPAVGHGTSFSDGRLTLAGAITPPSDETVVLGTIVITSDMREFAALSRRIWVAEILIVLVAFGVAFFLSVRMQKMILAPISELSATAKTVQEKGDYSARIEKPGNDELGKLGSAFNGMLQQIEHHDTVLREREAHFRSLIENSSDLIVLFDSEGTILYQSPSAERLIGYRPEERIGQSILQLVHPDDKIALSDLITRLLVDRVAPQSTTVRVRHKDSSWQVFDALANVHDDTDGHPIGIINARDITERSRMEEEQEHLSSQLQRAQRMEAIGTLAGGIAHDFNNLLQAILGYADLARADTPESSAASSSIDEVLAAGRRASDLVNRILRFSRESSPERRPMRIQDSISEVVGLLRPSLPSTIEIRENISPECPPVLADPTEVHQVIMNLCTNAYHAMRDHGGILELVLDETDVDEELVDRVPKLVVGRYAHLTVRDTGIGMDETTLSRLFDLYFTTKQPDKGTGLGLATTLKIVESDGGAISVESTVGEGSSFEIFLPLAEPTSGIEEHVSAEPARQRGSERILFVDDEALLVELCKTGLERLGYSVEGYTSSVEALNRFRSAPENFDLVITDQTMPQMTGVELAEQLFVSKPDVPVILCTGFSELVDRNRAIAAGVREYVDKPVTTNSLATTVRSVLDK